ncbi:efflux RND transporter periplasmic adaptor subunit [Sphingomonas quercus]|uniref:Efflux RND transporter periplasmic adaptor subunit n=1 Tax=Sphingomonas quercus TaxID=2842451 RepID=A0ABS6BIA0_9SPHN|nr:efflux RND transporter periplasmic adaptor subunit [Sphingomonas quercus]MBU3078035.1 efflux RND transporter periplasmic adaptor subunit [Sphingomonas quercus]
MNLERGFVGRRPASVDGDGVDTEAPDRRRLVIILVIVAVLVAGALAVMLKSRGGAPEAPPAALPHITVLVPGRQAVTTSIATTGVIAAKRDMPVGVAGEGGLVRRVLVDAGDWVKAGQVLAIVDRQVQVQQTAQMSAQVASAKADARLAQIDLERSQKLVANGFVTQATIDQKTATRDAANARVKLAEAQLGEMSARLGRLDIRAPTSGLVLARMVEPGQIVMPSSGALFRIAMDGQLEMQARLAEGDLARLHVGSPAVVTPVGDSKGFKGEIWQMAPVIDSTSRQGTARIAVSYDPALRPGGFASAVVTGAAGVAPMLPESAVMSDQTGNFVFLVGSDDRVERRAVTVGDVNDKGVTITKGLSGDERVVESAGAFLNPGDRVLPVTKPAARAADTAR